MNILQESVSIEPTILANQSIKVYEPSPVRGSSMMVEQDQHHAVVAIAFPPLCAPSIILSRSTLKRREIVLPFCVQRFLAANWKIFGFWFLSVLLLGVKYGYAL